MTLRKRGVNKSLGSMYRTQKTASEQGLPSLKLMIDAELRNGNKPFSAESIRTTVETALGFCEDLIRGKTELARSEARRGLLSALLDVVDAGFLSYEGSGDSFLHPSSFGSDCNRRVFYTVTGQEKSNPLANDITPNVQRIFDLGTLIHVYLQSLLKKIGVLEEAEAPAVNHKLRINGRLDGRLKFKGLPYSVVLEIKSINSYGFKSIQQAPKNAHLEQALTYAVQDGSEYIYFLYFNKDTSELKEHIVKVSDKKPLWRHLEKKYLEVNRAIDTKEVPHRDCNSINDKQAVSCEFRDFCFHKKTLLKTKNLLSDAIFKKEYNTQERRKRAFKPLKRAQK